MLPVLKRFDGLLSNDQEILQRAAIAVRYEGYIEKQQREIDSFKKLEHEAIPTNFSYDHVPGLKTEAREKFIRFRPVSLGQAGRLEGVTPGDMAVLAVSLKRHKASHA